jgi:hypothetical protein
MSDLNPEAFYAELDARMAIPDDDNWHNFSELRRKYCIALFTFQNGWLIPVLVANSTSGSSELFPSNDNPVHPVEDSPTVPMYMFFLQPIESYPHVSLAGRVSARHHRDLINPYRRKGGRSKALSLPQ